MPANPNDGTTLGTAEVMADEYISPDAGAKSLRDAQGGAYKLPRSKIAVGPYGQDGGDATHDAPLPVLDRVMARFAELDAVRDREDTLVNLCDKYAYERVSLADSRGKALSTRGVR